jgi:hypothetical protein
MFQTLIVLFCVVIAAVSAFHVPSSRFLSAKTPSSALKMSAEGLAGALPPLGYFDPLGITNEKTPAEVKKIREAELKHGRVAMLAFLGILTGESFNPLFNGQITGPAIYQFQQADNIVPFFWVGVLFLIALIEGQNILVGWESPDKTFGRDNGIANLREDYVNGDLGFDPLGFKPTNEDAFNSIRTKELQNGRLAMLGVAGIVAQELVNGKSVLENFYGN